MLVGHAEPGAAFRAAFVGGAMHHAWLLTGPPGIGKAAFAEAAATWVLARSAGPRVRDNSFEVHPDHPMAHLMAAASHPDFRRLERTTDDKGKLRTVIRVDEVRALSPLFQRTPFMSDWRVVVIDALDEMNRAAANAFLKSLEEPPPGTLFLALSHSPGRLLPTIRSRCRTLRFQPLSDAQVARVIAAERPELSGDEIAALVAVAEGAPGRALGLADAGIAGLTADLDALAVAAKGEATARALTLAKSLAGKAAGARYTAFLDLAPAYLARAAKARPAARSARAVGLWERANDLVGGAVALALEPQSVAFELALLVAGLAE